MKARDEKQIKRVFFSVFFFFLDIFLSDPGLFDNGIPEFLPS